MTLQSSFQMSVNTLWAQTSLLKTVTYVRPPALTHDSSIVEPTETRANCSAHVATERVAGLGRAARETRVFHIRASELSAVLALGELRKGDFLIDTTGKAFSVYSAHAILGELVWRIYTLETIDDDSGAIALAHTDSADHGDLNAETSAEDLGALYL